MKKSLEVDNTSGFWAWGLVQKIIGISLLFFIGIFLMNGFNEQSARLLIRWSARVSAISFGFAFGASAFHRWQQNSFSFWILMNRRYLGITFAIMHLIHLSALLGLQYFFHPVFTIAKKTALMAGGTAYFFLVLMLLTSFQTFSKYLTKAQWKILHLVGAYWIWGIFFNSNFRNVVMRGRYEYLPMLLFLVFVFIIRLIRKPNNRRTSFFL